MELKRKEAFYFYIVWLLFLLPASVYLIFNSKGDFSLLLNREHHEVADLLFKYITLLGDIYGVTAVCVLLLFIRIRFGVVVIFNSIVVFLFTALLKNLFNEDRPSLYFAPNMNLHFVPGVDLYQHYSFPSGHTSAAFCIFYTLAWFAKNHWVQIICAVLAILVALSRIYLMQHFLIDVYAGSILAVVITYFLMRYYTKKTRLLSGTYLNYSLAGRK